MIYSLTSSDDETSTLIGSFDVIQYTGIVGSMIDWPLVAYTWHEWVSFGVNWPAITVDVMVGICISISPTLVAYNVSMVVVADCI